MSRTIGNADFPPVAEILSVRSRGGDGLQQRKTADREFSMHVLVAQSMSESAVSRPQLDPVDDEKLEPGTELINQIAPSMLAELSLKQQSAVGEVFPGINHDGRSDANGDPAIGADQEVAPNSAGNLAAPHPKFRNHGADYQGLGDDGIAEESASLSQEVALAHMQGRALIEPTTNEIPKGKHMMPADRGSDVSKTGHTQLAEAKSRSEATSAGPIIKVVRQESHIPVISSQSPAGQIAQALVGASSEVTDPGVMGRLDTPVTSVLPTGNVTRVLQIQLQPTELGSVNVRMTLKGGVLELRIEAERAATAELMRQDQGALTSLLRSAGYDVDGVVVHLAETERGLPASTNSGQQGFQANSQSSSFSQSGSSRPGSEPWENSQPRSQRQDRAADGPTEADVAGGPQSTRPRGNGIYV